jgi:DNA anti-recombination protein RmuC
MRQIDASGNLITQRLDSNGNVLDQSNSNINDALAAIQSNTGSLSDRISAGFQDVASGQADITSGQEGLMAEAAANQGMIRDQSTAIMQGFNSADGKMDTQIRDLARVAASQGDIAIENRQEFKQIGDAFDDQGNLIRNSIDANGNTVSRAIDNNGNLLLRSFDVNGRAIGDKVMNINKSLNQLAQLPYMAGANTSMGNLSPAMKANVPQGGFMSPFAQTR